MNSPKKIKSIVCTLFIRYTHKPKKKMSILIESVFPSSKMKKKNMGKKKVKEKKFVQLMANECIFIYITLEISKYGELWPLYCR